MMGKEFVKPKSKRQKDLADIFRIVEKFPKLEATLPRSIREEMNE